MLAIDADPHEAEETVSEHILTNAFEGNFVSAPVSVSREMIPGSRHRGNALSAADDHYQWWEGPDAGIRSFS